MARTIQVLVSTGQFTINSNQVLDVPCGLQDEDGNVLAPKSVAIEGLANVLSYNADGSFTAWNGTILNDMPVKWTAYHDTIELDDPAHPESDPPTPSQTPPPGPIWLIPV